jgi:predicted nucleic acid-binding protein
MKPRVYVDTNIFIEAFEKDGEDSEVARLVFEWFRSSRGLAVVSELTVAELLVKPIRDNDSDLIEAYTDLIYSPNLYLVCPVERSVLMEAAHQRAFYPATKLPDAIHVATALLQKCRVFLTTDARLPTPAGLTCVGLGASTISDLQALT